MKDYGTVRSTVHPEPVKVDEFSVWKHSDIREIAENVESEQLSEQITDTQLALCELCENTEV